MRRKVGYYWIKLLDSWYIAQYQSNAYWYILCDPGEINNPDDWEDDEFEEIDENQINKK